jgi:hypothetical protein
MSAYKTKVANPDPLADYQTNDPENREDKLPFPYSMIADVLQETVIYQLNLKMHQIEEKKKTANYEGAVKGYISQTCLDLEGISCLSRPHKSHNHLLAGGKSGTVYLLDLAKRAVFSK